MKINGIAMKNMINIIITSSSYSHMSYNMGYIYV
jgi:hypothetical protein